MAAKSMCMIGYREGEPVDVGPLAEFQEGMNTNQLLAAYQVHAEQAVRVDVTKLTQWEYIRKTHKKIVTAIKDDMLRDTVRCDSPLYILHENNSIQPGKALIVDGNHRHLAMEQILALSDASEKNKKAKDTIKAGVYAIILHPDTPDRVLYMLATAAAAKKIQCEVGLLAFLEHVYSKRDFTASISPEKGRRLRICHGDITSAQVQEFYNDWKRLSREGHMKSAKSAEPYAAIVNNPHSQDIFAWCIKKDFNDFLFAPNTFKAGALRYIFTHWRSQADPENEGSDKKWFERFLKECFQNADVKSGSQLEEKAAVVIAWKWLNNRRVYEFLQTDTKCLEQKNSASYDAAVKACLSGRFITDSELRIQEPPPDVRDAESTVWKDVISEVDRCLGLAGAAPGRKSQKKRELEAKKNQKTKPKEKKPKTVEALDDANADDEEDGKAEGRSKESESQKGSKKESEESDSDNGGDVAAADAPPADGEGESTHGDGDSCVEADVYFPVRPLPETFDLFEPARHICANKPTLLKAVPEFGVARGRIFGDLYEQVGQDIMAEISREKHTVAGNSDLRKCVFRPLQEQGDHVKVHCVICTDKDNEMSLVMSAMVKCDAPDILLCFIPSSHGNDCVSRITEHATNCGHVVTVLRQIACQNPRTKHLSIWNAVITHKKSVCSLALTSDSSMPLFQLSPLQMWYIDERSAVPKSQVHDHIVPFAAVNHILYCIDFVSKETVPVVLEEYADELSGVNSALIAGLSGFAASCSYGERTPSEDEMKYSVQLKQTYDLLVGLAGGPAPSVVRFGGLVIAPARFAKTFQYQTMEDMQTIADMKKNRAIRQDFVSDLGWRLFIKFISAEKGFGVFTAEDIPHLQGAVQYAASYGGVVCTAAEYLPTSDVYRVLGRKLPAGSGRSSQSRNNFVYVDACDLRSGDGRFINGDCYANTEVEDMVNTMPAGSEKTAAAIAAAISSPYVVTLMRTTRRVSCGKELTVAYEPEATTFSPNDLVGGAYRAVECNCGSALCIGEIIRRIQDEMAQNDDFEFISIALGTRTSPEKMIFDVVLLKNANRHYWNARRKIGPDEDYDDDELKHDAIMKAKKEIEEEQGIRKGVLCNNVASKKEAALRVFRCECVPRSMAITAFME